MIRFDSTTHLEAFPFADTTDQPLNVVVQFSDQTATTYVGKAPTYAQLSDGAGAVTICPSPDADQLRTVDYISVINADSVAAQMIVRYSGGGDLCRTTLDPGDHAEYTHAGGWRVTTADGSLKGAGGASGGDSSSYVDCATPVGDIDGTNTVYLLAQIPDPAGSLILHRNGLIQSIEAGNFTRSGLQITYAIPLEIGDTHEYWLRF